jgi:hypothetical protein
MVPISILLTQRGDKREASTGRFDTYEKNGRGRKSKQELKIMSLSKEKSLKNELCGTN